jgi:hypothetical protein
MRCEKCGFEYSSVNIVCPSCYMNEIHAEIHKKIRISKLFFLLSLFCMIPIPLLSKNESDISKFLFFIAVLLGVICIISLFVYIFYTNKRKRIEQKIIQGNITEPIPLNSAPKNQNIPISLNTFSMKTYFYCKALWRKVDKTSLVVLSFSATVLLIIWGYMLLKQADFIAFVIYLLFVAVTVKLYLSHLYKKVVREEIVELLKNIDIIFGPCHKCKKERECIHTNYVLSYITHESEKDYGSYKSYFSTYRFVEFINIKICGMCFIKEKLVFIAMLISFIFIFISLVLQNFILMNFFIISLILAGLLLSRYGINNNKISGHNEKEYKIFKKDDWESLKKY